MCWQSHWSSEKIVFLIQEQGLYVLSCEFFCVTCCTKMFILSADIPRLSGLRGRTRSLSQFNCQMQKMLRLILGLMEILHSLLVLVQRTILMKWNWTFLTKLMLRWGMVCPVFILLLLGSYQIFTMSSMQLFSGFFFPVADTLLHLILCRKAK